MPTSHVIKDAEKPLILTRGLKTTRVHRTPVRQNALLFSGITLVVVAASMVIETVMS